jgi:hypothetical protein
VRTLHRCDVVFTEATPKPTTEATPNPTTGEGSISERGLREGGISERGLREGGISEGGGLALVLEGDGFLYNMVRRGRARARARARGRGRARGMGRGRGRGRIRAGRLPVQLGAYPYP